MEMKISHLGYNIVYIDTETKLQACVADLKTQRVVGFDLEFDNNYFKYGFHLCLIQVATNNTCYIIDPIALKTQQLKPFFDILENPHIQKVAHSSGEDLRLLQSVGCKLQNLFDTDIAVKLLNYEKISLGNIVQAKLGVILDKSMQISNWHLRPLSAEQLVYAANDVLFLLRLREHFIKDLQGEKQIWFEQEMANVVSIIYENEVKEDFLSKADRKELGNFDQFVMNELLRYRDTLARNLNRASHRVMSTEPLRALVQNPENVEHWQQMKGYYHALKTPKIQEELKRVLQHAQQEAHAKQLPRERVSHRMSNEAYQAELKLRAERQRVKEEVFKPIQTQLANRYGEFAAIYLLSNVTVGDIVTGKLKVSDIKVAYKRQIINEIAQELHVDLSNYQ